MITPPIMVTWDGDALIPKVPRLADKHFVVGETFPVIRHEARSAASHGHFFASIAEAHASLPNDLAERYPTAEHLRKYALIRAGFADERSIVCASKAEALRVAAFIRPMDDYAIVVASDATVKVFTAKSQSLKAMGRKDFQASKDAVLDVIATMIGVKAGDLPKERAA